MDRLAGGYTKEGYGLGTYALRNAQLCKKAVQSAGNGNYTWRAILIQSLFVEGAGFVRGGESLPDEGILAAPVGGDSLLLQVC